MSLQRLVRCALVWVGAIGSLAASGAARAAVVVPYDLKGMAGSAEIIAIGRVDRSESHWEGGRIVTLTTLATHKLLKGAAGDHLVVRTLGGVVDGIGQWVPGEARFLPGETAIVFLTPSSGGRGSPEAAPEAAPTPRMWRVVGMAQGKLQVKPEPSGVVVLRDLHHITPATPNGAEGSAQPDKPLLAERQSLDLFLTRLADVLAGPTPPPQPKDP